ncbi:MAG: c-type cytochrome [Phycisphaerales bacterium]|nr:c-type cytochrome [Phycisphaerales bacterium]
MMRLVLASLLCLPARIEPPATQGGTSAHDHRLGGPATVMESGSNAFSLPLPGLSVEDRRAFSVGNSLFRDNWVVAPASASGRDGLGPLFNANSCSACHPHDGRGRPPQSADDVGRGMVTFVSPQSDDGRPHPLYGKQIQDQAIPGARAEARVSLEPTLMHGTYPDGTPWELMRWTVALESPAYGEFGDVRASVRIGQQLVGMGLLEAVPDESILAMADPDDRNGDGISGRAHALRHAPAHGVEAPRKVGRFGWKASQPTIGAQVVAALHEDMGITSDAHRDEALTARQRESAAHASGGDPEIDAHRVRRISHYVRALAVPAQRNADSAAGAKGRALFDSLGCAACHTPTLVTGPDSPLEPLRNVTFHPYTDLLLHDMGDGLADNRCDGDASGREWRTPPLWGIGLIETVNGHTRYLHDGRARSLEEAVLWHGGEAERARSAFIHLPSRDRAALLAFLESL